MKSVQPERTANAALPGGGPVQSLLLRLELKSDPKLLCAVRGAVERLTESFGFSSEECRAVTRAVDEALTNIIRHAYGGRPDQPIEVFFQSVHRQSGNLSDRGLEILLCDRGQAIDESKLCGRELDDVKPGGLGLHFIQKSMDIVEFKRADGTNRLRLVKYLSAPKQGVNT
jgi:anti-sigma regulatory factor (Ser/Thr protein kinase)